MDYKRIALFYGHSASNLGDLAINAGECQLLKTLYPNAELNIVFLDSTKSRYLDAAKESFLAHAQPHFRYVDTTDGELIKNLLTDPPYLLDSLGLSYCDAIFVSSGEHLFQYSNRANTHSIFWRTLPLLAAKMRGKFAAIMPSTYGPFDDSESQLLIKEVLSLSDFAFARDSDSYQLITDLTNGKAGVLGPDPAFFLNYQQFRNPLVSGRLGLVMRSEGWGIRVPATTRTKATSAFRAEAYQTSKAFQFAVSMISESLPRFPLGIHIFVQTLADKELAEAILSHFRDKPIFNDKITLVFPSSIDTYLKALSQVDELVTSRFHAAIFGLMLGKRVSAPYFPQHGHKLPGLFRYLNRPQYCSDLSTETVESSVDRINALALLPWETEKLFSLIHREKHRLTHRLQSYQRLSQSHDIPGLKDRYQKLLLAVLLDTNQNIRDRAKRRLEESRTALRDTRKALTTATRISEQLRTQLDQTHEALTSARDQSAQLSIQLTHARTVAESAKAESARLRVLRQKSQGSLVRQKNKLAQLTSSTTYLVGKQFVKDAKRPHHWAILPIKIARIYIRYRNRVSQIKQNDAPRVPKPTIPPRIIVEENAILSQAPPSASTIVLPGHNVRRICYLLHNSFPYSSGGYATRAHGVACGLRANGFEVVCLTRPGFPLDVDASISIDHVAEHQIDGVVYKRINHPLRKGLSTGEYMQTILAPIEAALQSIKPDLLIAASFYLTALPGLIAARRIGIPFVYEVRGLAEITKISREPAFGDTKAYENKVFMEAETAKRSDHVLTLTHQMKEELVSRGVPSEKITLLPNSTNLKDFVPQPKNRSLAAELLIPVNVPVIGYIGSFVDYEGLEDLVFASGLLKSKGVEFRVLIVGSENVTTGAVGPITKMIKEYASRSDLADWLILPGRVPHEKVQQYYSLIDIATFPRKPWPVCEMVSPMKPLEAMAMQKAVVVSSVKALSDMVQPGTTGCVFEKGNPEDLAEILSSLIGDPSLRVRLGVNARAWVEKNRSWAVNTKAALSNIFAGMPRETVVSQSSSSNHPVWWEAVPTDFRDRSSFVDVTAWDLSKAATDLKKHYESQFGHEIVGKRIPLKNWQRADICSQLVAKIKPHEVLDVGSGLGEFVNLFASNFPHIPIASVDVRDYSLWHDRTGRVDRIYKSIFQLGAKETRDVVTCFEVIEHLPSERLVEAVGILRSLAKRALFISVPFMEPLPLYKGHFTRFDDKLLLSLFPDAKFTIFGKGAKNSRKVRAWIMCEIAITPTIHGV